MAGQIAVVVSDSPETDNLTDLLRRHRIAYKAVPLRSYARETRNQQLSDEILSAFEQHRVDYGFVFGSRILKGKLLNQYRDRLINFHPSVLPAFKGLNAIDAALLDRAFLLGNSAHFIVEEVDAGPVIMQQLTHARSFNDYEDILGHQVPMLYQIILWINADRLHVDNGYAIVRNADYTISEYIPRLEFHS
jgi:folate-dependent phosphoribosylglycinamide formyltransferase PurN